MKPEQLRDRRVVARLTQADLALAIGVWRGTVSRVEQGRLKPSADLEFAWIAATDLIVAVARSDRRSVEELTGTYRERIPVGSIWRHLKSGGIYRILQPVGLLQMVDEHYDGAPIVTYGGQTAGHGPFRFASGPFHRPAIEFLARFEQVG